MIKNFSLIFRSKTKAQEIILLLQNVKPVVRQGFYPEEFFKVERFCEKNNLYVVKSKFKVLLAEESSFTNKGIRVKSDDPRDGMFFFYISKDEHKAWLASYYELISNDADLGILLGYPSCCVKFFCKRFSEDNPNLQLPPTNLFTNITKREDDCVIISHFPCHSNCRESIGLAQKYLDVISNADCQRAIELLETLKVAQSGNGQNPKPPGE